MSTSAAVLRLNTYIGHLLALVLTQLHMHHSPGIGRLAIDWMEQTVEEESISSDWQRVPGYIFPATNDPDSLQHLEQELQVLLSMPVTKDTWWFLSSGLQASPSAASKIDLSLI